MSALKLTQNGNDGSGAQTHEALAQCAGRAGEVTIWLSRQLILAVHNERRAEHSGAVGVRDEELLESALGREENFVEWVRAHARVQN